MKQEQIAQSKQAVFIGKQERSIVYSQFESKYAEKNRSYLAGNLYDLLTKVRKQLLSKKVEASFNTERLKCSDTMHLYLVCHSANYEVIIIHCKYLNIFAEIEILNVDHFNRRSQVLFQESGSYGSVYTCQTEEEKVAIKYLLYQNDPQIFESIFYQAVQEFVITKIASALEAGPYISKIFGFDIIVYRDTIQFAMEICQMKKEPNHKNQMREDLQKSLAFLNYLQIVHCDIKPCNIAFSYQFNKYVFIDFGLSLMICQKLGMKKHIGFRGSASYCGKQMRTIFLSKLKEKRYVDLYYNDFQCLQNSLKQFEQCQDYIQIFQKRTDKNLNIAYQSVLYRVKYLLFNNDSKEKMQKLEKLYQKNRKITQSSQFTSIINKFIKILPRQLYLQNFCKVHLGKTFHSQYSRRTSFYGSVYNNKDQSYSLDNFCQKFRYLSSQYKQLRFQLSADQLNQCWETENEEQKNKTYQMMFQKLYCQFTITSFQGLLNKCSKLKFSDQSLSKLNVLDLYKHFAHQILYYCLFQGPKKIDKVIFIKLLLNVNVILEIQTQEMIILIFQQLFHQKFELLEVFQLVSSFIVTLQWITFRFRSIYNYNNIFHQICSIYSKQIDRYHPNNPNQQFVGKLFQQVFCHKNYNIKPLSQLHHKIDKLAKSQFLNIRQNNILNNLSQYLHHRLVAEHEPINSLSLVAGLGYQLSRYFKYNLQKLRKLGNFINSAYVSDPVCGILWSSFATILPFNIHKDYYIYVMYLFEKIAWQVQYFQQRPWLQKQRDTYSLEQITEIKDIFLYLLNNKCQIKAFSFIFTTIQKMKSQYLSNFIYSKTDQIIQILFQHSIKINNLSCKSLGLQTFGTHHRYYLAFNHQFIYKKDIFSILSSLQKTQSKKQTVDNSILYYFCTLTEALNQIPCLHCKFATAFELKIQIIEWQINFYYNNHLPQTIVNGLCKYSPQILSWQFIQQNNEQIQPNKNNLNSIQIEQYIQTLIQYLINGLKFLLNVPTRQQNKKLVYRTVALAAFQQLLLNRLCQGNRFSSKYNIIELYISLVVRLKLYDQMYCYFQGVIWFKTLYDYLHNYKQSNALINVMEEILTNLLRQSAVQFNIFYTSLVHCCHSAKLRSKDDLSLYYSDIVEHFLNRFRLQHNSVIGAYFSAILNIESKKLSFQRMYKVIISSFSELNQQRIRIILRNRYYETYLFYYSCTGRKLSYIYCKSTKIITNSLNQFIKKRLIWEKTQRFDNVKLKKVQKSIVKYFENIKNK